MSDHHIVWTHDADTVTSHAVCNAPIGADCRLTCEDGCESWGAIQREGKGFDGRPYHLTEADEKHYMAPCPCTVVEWMDAGWAGVDELDHKHETFEIGRIDFTPEWTGYGYEWVRDV